MSSDNIKVRPYLSVSELKYISEKLSSDISPIAVRIKTNLAQIILKYDAGFIKGSYTAKPRASISDNLGFNSDLEESRYLNGEMSAEESEAYELKLLGGSLD